MSALTRLRATTVLSVDATLKFGQTTFQLDTGLRASLFREIQMVGDLDLPAFIDQVELHEDGRLLVHSLWEESREVRALFLPTKAILEEHLFERGQALCSAQKVQNESGFRAKCVILAQKAAAVADGWGAIRNAVGCTFAVIKILALLGVITLTPHAFFTMLIIYGCLVLVQGILSVGPLFIGGTAEGVLQSRMAEALADKTHQRSAFLKKWGGFFSLVEGSLWIAIAICDFSGMITLSATLTKILFWGIFNFTFIYMASCSGRDFKRHNKFRKALKTRLEDPNCKNDFERYHNALTYVRDKWYMHLKPKHAHYSERELVQKAGRKTYRLEEQTSEGSLARMEDLDALLERLDKGDAQAIKDAQILVGELLVENKKKLIVDFVTIFLGVVGVFCWFDIMIVFAGYTNAGEIADWVLWVFLNAGFLFMSSWGRFSDKFAAHFTKSEIPQAQ